MRTAHTYQVYIRAEIEDVFAALIDPAFTRKYFHGTAFDSPPVAGRPYLTVLPDGEPAVDGVIEVLDPPHRLVQTWHTRYDEALAAEPPSRVEWTLSRAGDGLTRVRLVHGDLAFSPLTWANVKDGWVWILDSLKSLLENGSALPPVTVEEGAAPASAAEVGKDWHRMQAVEANNATWDLLERKDFADAAWRRDVVRGAYAAAWHWQRARGALPANEVRALYLISKAQLAAGAPRLALDAADDALRLCGAADLADFDLAYAHEARARALAALGDDEASLAAWAAARAVPIEDDEDRAIVEKDFADAPA